MNEEIRGVLFPLQFTDKGQVTVETEPGQKAIWTPINPRQLTHWRAKHWDIVSRRLQIDHLVRLAEHVLGSGVAVRDDLVHFVGTLGLANGHLVHDEIHDRQRIAEEGPDMRDLSPPSLTVYNVGHARRRKPANGPRPTLVMEGGATRMDIDRALFHAITDHEPPKSYGVFMVGDDMIADVITHRRPDGTPDLKGNLSVYFRPYEAEG